MNELRKACEKWMEEVDDKGNIPEEELIKSFWPNKIQPSSNKKKTDAPIIKKIRNKLVATCQTEGANVGYKLQNLQNDTSAD